jgi:hypothetical protein
MSGTKDTPKKRTRPTKNWRDKVLKYLSETGNIADACKRAGVVKSTFYRHRDKDPEFALALSEAIEVSIENLELEARRRAEKGTKKPIYQKGQLEAIEASIENHKESFPHEKLTRTVSPSFFTCRKMEVLGREPTPNTITYPEDRTLICEEFGKIMDEVGRRENARRATESLRKVTESLGRSADQAAFQAAVQRSIDQLSE